MIALHPIILHSDHLAFHSTPVFQPDLLAASPAPDIGLDDALDFLSELEGAVYSRK